MTFEQIGQKLKAAREGQGLSLVQIWERTKIPMHHLQSMETGVTDDLPETVYVAGFIKRYADVVGLNGQNLAEEYRKEAAPVSNGNGNGHFRREKNSNQSVVVVPAPYMGKTRIETGPPSVVKMLVFPSLFAILVIGLLALLLQWHSYNSMEQPDPSVLSLANKKLNDVQPTTTTVAPPTTGPVQPGVTPPGPTSSSVAITASKHVWLDVKSISTNDTLFNGFLEAGDRRDFKDPQGIRIHAGNGGSVTVEADGKSELLGANGKIAEKTYAIKGATAAPTTGADATKPDGTGTAVITTPKPVIKKPVKRVTSDAAAVARRRAAEAARQNAQNDGAGSGRSADVPYRYTEGRLDTDQ